MMRNVQLMCAACAVLAVPSFGTSQERKGVASWALFRGDPQRTSQIATITKATEKPWRRSVFFEFDKEGIEISAWPRKLIQEVSQQNLRMPGFFPLAYKDGVFLRNYSEIARACLLPQRDEIFGPPEGRSAGEIFWRSFPLDFSLCSLASNPRTRPVMESLVRYYKDKEHDHCLFTNGSIGTLSSDDRLIYAIDEWPLPVPASLVDKFEKRVHQQIDKNWLGAFDIHTGRAKWAIGSHYERDKEWSDTFFLGAPLPLATKLYALIEKESAIRLVCFEPHQLQAIRPKVERIVLVTKVDAAQLVNTNLRRRLNPVHIAYSDGLLICPTHTGELYAIDGKTLEVRWKAKYAELEKEAKLQSEWIGCAPIVHDGKILFTPPDASFLFCYRMSDGQLLWKTARVDDLFVATTYRDRVLLIGKGNCRLLSLTDGKEVKALQTGTPAGLGFAHQRRYFLPLRNANGTIAVVDMQEGTIERDWRTPESDLGNIIYHHGMVISQSALTIAAFPMIELAK